MRIDLATEPADNTIANEDFGAATADTVIVLDGVTPLDRGDVGCRHGVAWFARTLGADLLAHASGGTAPLTDCLAAAIETTRDRHAVTCDPNHPDSPAATVTAVRIGAGELEYLVLADSPLVLDAGGSLTVITDDRPARTGRRVRAAETYPTSMELARAIRARRNRSDGYWVAAEDPAAAGAARTGRVPLAGLDRVVLASDGAARPVEELGLTDWREALRALEKEGVRAWLARTRAAERADAQQRRASGAPPRWKVHDDATIAVLTELR